MVPTPLSSPVRYVVRVFPYQIAACLVWIFVCCVNANDRREWLHSGLSTGKIVNNSSIVMWPVILGLSILQGKRNREDSDSEHKNISTIAFKNATAHLIFSLVTLFLLYAVGQTVSLLHGSPIALVPMRGVILVLAGVLACSSWGRVIGYLVPHYICVVFFPCVLYGIYLFSVFIGSPFDPFIFTGVSVVAGDAYERAMLPVVLLLVSFIMAFVAALLLGKLIKSLCLRSAGSEQESSHLTHSHSERYPKAVWLALFGVVSLLSFVSLAEANRMEMWRTSGVDSWVCRQVAKHSHACLPRDLREQSEEYFSAMGFADKYLRYMTKNEEDSLLYAPTLEAGGGEYSGATLVYVATSVENPRHLWASYVFTHVAMNANFTKNYRCEASLLQPDTVMSYWEEALEGKPVDQLFLEELSGPLAACS